jgi:hypothetical protein
LTRALFVSLSSDKTLHWLRQSLQKELPQSSAGEFEPHLSLLYQLLPVTVRAKLAEEIILPFNTICFDQIRAVAIPETINVPEDLTGWQTLVSCRLDSSAITDKIQRSHFAQQSNQGKGNGRQDRNRPG